MSKNSPPEGFSIHGDVTYRQQQNQYYSMIKLKFGQQVHLGRVNGRPQFEELRVTVRRVFPGVAQSFEFFYEDEEGDELTLSNQEDLDTIVQLNAQNGQPTNKNILRLQVRQIQQSHLPPTHEEKQDDFYQQLDELYPESDPEILDLSCSSPFEQVRSQTSQHSQTSELLDSSAQPDLAQEQLIRSLVRRNLSQINQQCIRSYVEQRQAMSDEVQCYLHGMYRNIENAAEQEGRKQQEKRREKRQRREIMENEEIAQMVERSLKKLLPDFIATATQQAVERVTLLLSHQTPQTRHKLTVSHPSSLTILPHSSQTLPQP